MKKNIRISLMIVLIFILGIGAWAMFGPGKADIITDADHYLDKESFQGKSGLALFPDEVDSARAETYYYDYQDNFLDASSQIYLHCTYTEEEFQKECDRLTTVAVSHNGETHTPRYNTTDYKVPAYEAIRAVDHCYEYALVDEKDHSVAYVFLQFVPENEVAFSSDALPVCYEDDGGTSDPHNMYAFPGERFAEGKGYELIYN